MNFRDERMESLAPVFIGVLSSLIFCATISASYVDVFSREKLDDAVVEIEEEEDDVFILAAFENSGFKKTNDPILEYFRDPEYSEWVIDFFSTLCSNMEITKTILDNSDIYNVPPALAFALSWEESRFNPRATSKPNRDGSIDRGLFQLNSRSFPNLPPSAFYEIKVNALHGISHLRLCIDSAASEIAALAMYNAGTGRVRSQGAPEVTLNYVSRILENKKMIEDRFNTRIIKEIDARAAMIEGLSSE